VAEILPSSFAGDGLNAVSWTTSPSPLPSDTEVAIGSAASSPSHVWVFGSYLSASAGEEPLILSHS
jgi:hypothetical protein